jgi:hypothetical protein
MKFKPIPLFGTDTVEQLKAKFDLWSEWLAKRCPEAVFEFGFFKVSKQLLDSTLRPLDFALARVHGAELADLRYRLAGGVQSMDLTFEEKAIIHATQAAFSDRADAEGQFPTMIKMTRAQLYDHLGVGWIVRADGTRYRAEAKGYARLKIERTLLGLSDKPFRFISTVPAGKARDGRSLFTTRILNAPIMKAAKVYEEHDQAALPGIIAQDAEGEKRFSHYEIIFNPNVSGDVERYFRHFPRQLPKQISDYRRKQGGRASTVELLFHEVLFQENREVIETSAVKLAKRLKIRHPRNKKILRETLRRCYKTAIALGYVVRVEEDVSTIRGATKEVIYCNPARFIGIDRRRLPPACPPGPEEA